MMSDRKRCDISSLYWWIMMRYVARCPLHSQSQEPTATARIVKYEISAQDGSKITPTDYGPPRYTAYFATIFCNQQFTYSNIFVATAPTEIYTHSLHVALPI